MGSMQIDEKLYIALLMANEAGMPGARVTLSSLPLLRGRLGLCGAACGQSWPFSTQASS